MLVTEYFGEIEGNVLEIRDYCFGEGDESPKVVVECEGLLYEIDLKDGDDRKAACRAFAEKRKVRVTQKIEVIS